MLTDRFMCTHAYMYRAYRSQEACTFEAMYTTHTFTHCLVRTDATIRLLPKNRWPLADNTATYVHDYKCASIVPPIGIQIMVNKQLLYHDNRKNVSHVLLKRPCAQGHTHSSGCITMCNMHNKYNVYPSLLFEYTRQC